MFEMEEIIERLETKRIDVKCETQYCDATGVLTEKLERANEMLDDCIDEVKQYFKDKINS